MYTYLTVLAQCSDVRIIAAGFFLVSECSFFSMLS